MQKEKNKQASFDANLMFTHWLLVYSYLAYSEYCYLANALHFCTFKERNWLDYEWIVNPAVEITQESYSPSSGQVNQVGKNIQIL